MLTIFNRRELFFTYDMNERVRICDILRSNSIDYRLKTVNATNTLGGGSRHRTGSFGINTDYAYEYHIYVHKDKLELAKHLIGR